jgi:hypothetical protein
MSLNSDTLFWFLDSPQYLFLLLQFSDYAEKQQLQSKEFQSREKKVAYAILSDAVWVNEWLLFNAKLAIFNVQCRSWREQVTFD